MSVLWVTGCPGPVSPASLTPVRLASNSLLAVRWSWLSFPQLVIPSSRRCLEGKRAQSEFFRSNSRTRTVELVAYIFDTRLLLLWWFWCFSPGSAEMISHHWRCEWKQSNGRSSVSPDHLINRINYAASEWLQMSLKCERSDDIR